MEISYQNLAKFLFYKQLRLTTPNSVNLMVKKLMKTRKGTYSCLCNSEMVDWSAANGDRPGTDCQEQDKPQKMFNVKKWLFST